MKRELIFMIGLSSAIYATQEISCVDFVNMSKNEAQSYLDSYRKEFELNHFKTKNHTDNDKNYISMQGGVSKHLLTCIDLRKVSHYGVEDVRRALILTSLSKKYLEAEEEDIYQKSLNENIQFYKPYSSSSLFNAYHMHLIYLTIQRLKDNRHYKIYEFRKNGAEIKRYSKKIPISQPYLSSRVSKNYLAYLNANPISPRLGYVPVYSDPQRVNVTPTPHNKIIIEQKIEQEYKIIKNFEAIRVSNGGNYIIESANGYPIITKETKNKVYFTINGEEYFASKKWWKRGTKQIGGFQ